MDCLQFQCIYYSLKILLTYEIWCYTLHSTYILINKRTLKKCNALYKYHYTSSIVLYARLPLLWPSHSLFCFFGIPAFQHSNSTGLAGPGQASHGILAFSSFRICTILSLYYVPIQTANSWTAGQVRSRSTNRYPIVSYSTRYYYIIDNIFF